MSRRDEGQGIGRSLKTPDKLRRPQGTLYGKAKREPGYRFDSLHDKVYREDVLRHAYALCRQEAGRVFEQTRRWMEAMRLTLNETKTKVRKARREPFDFLGYTFGLREHVRAHLRRSHQDPWDDVVATLNRKLRGWANDFR